jgi:transcriptional regulator with XRE-family HTH domain
VKISLKAARVNAGFSQESLAHKIGVSKSTISRWEIGSIQIPNNALDDICKICGLEKENIILQERKERNNYGNTNKSECL